jgi:hypothetical protein
MRALESVVKSNTKSNAKSNAQSSVLQAGKRLVKKPDSLSKALAKKTPVKKKTARKSKAVSKRASKKDAPSLDTTMSPSDLKYYLYERAVQCPDWHVKHFPRFYLWMTGKKALSLREDFCGTSRISMQWVRSDEKRTALGLDLDPEPLSYFERVHAPTLEAGERKRIRQQRKNVLSVTKEKFDLVAACNFSFFIFKERKTLLQYFKAVRKSLKKDGALFLELAGGEGMREGMEEERMFKAPGIGKVRYVWDQMDCNEITNVNDYAIHFQLPNKRWIRDAFEYHWRLWSIPELRDILAEAGFKKSHVFWELAGPRGASTGEYVPTEDGDPSHAWIAYIGAIA